MRLSLPRAAAPIADGKIMEREWRMFMSELFRSLGWDNLQRMHATRDMSINGALTNTAPAPSEVIYLRIPNDYVEGTDIIPFLYWVEDSIAGSGNAVFEIECSAPDEYSEFSVVLSESLDAVTVTRDTVVMTEFSTISGSSLAKGDVLKMEFIRNTVHADDTFSGTIQALTGGFSYQREGIGWETAHP